MSPTATTARPFWSPKQATVINAANARWNIMSGAVRSGKTYCSYFLLPIRVCELPKAHNNGGVLLIGKTERTLKRNVLDPMRDIFGEAYISAVYGDGEVRLFGRRCYIVGANDERAVTKIQGLTLSYAYGDEVTTWPESFFQMLKSRLSVPGAKFDGTCNPESPYHWLKEFIDTANNLNHFHFRLDDNMFLDPDFVTAIKSEYVGMWYQRYILGQWCMAEGLVYDVFDESMIVDKLPSILRVHIGVDYGVSNPTAFIMLGEGADGNLYVMREYYYGSKGKNIQSRRTAIDHANQMVDFLAGQRAEWIFVDPSAIEFITQLWRMKGKHPNFSRVANAYNDVANGIRRVASLFGGGRLKIHRSCSNLIKELQNYVWDEKATQRGEDKPIKDNDHACDALRYVVASMRTEKYLNGAQEAAVA